MPNLGYKFACSLLIVILWGCSKDPEVPTPAISRSRPILTLVNSNTLPVYSRPGEQILLVFGATASVELRRLWGKSTGLTPNSPQLLRLDRRKQGSTISLDSVFVSASSPGEHRIQAAVTDALGQVSDTLSFTLSIRPDDDTAPPTLTTNLNYRVLRPKDTLIFRATFSDNRALNRFQFTFEPQNPNTPNWLPPIAGRLYGKSEQRQFRYIIPDSANVGFYTLTGFVEDLSSNRSPNISQQIAISVKNCDITIDKFSVDNVDAKLTLNLIALSINDLTLKVVNTSGQIVIQQTYATVFGQNNAIIIPLTGLSNGDYSLIIQCESGLTISERFILNR